MTATIERHRLPDGSYATVGSLASAEALAHLPIGSVLQDGGLSQRTWRREPRGWQMIDNGTPVGSPRNPEHTLAAGYNRIVSIGAADGDDDGDDDGGYETLAQYQARFVKHVTDAARDHSINLEYVNSVLAKLNIAEGAVIPGSTITHDTDAPDGTVVMFGYVTDPTMTIWERRGGRWHKVTGHFRRVRDVGRVRVVDAPAPEGDGVGSAEQEAAKIAAFKREAWRVGWRAKQESSWCTTYDHIMAQFGLTAAVVVPTTSGRTMTVTDALGYADGSVFIFHGRSLWGMTMRDRTRDHGFRRIMGTSSRSYAIAMGLLYDAASGEPMRIPVDPGLMDAAPTGAVVTSGGIQYTKFSNGWGRDARTPRFQPGDFEMHRTFFVGGL